MTDVTLNAEKREQVGSRPARRLRAAGRVPASISGEGRPNLDIHLELSEFQAARRAHHNLFDLKVGSEVETAIVRELQWDQLGEHLIHIELRRVTRGKPIDSEVSLEFHGQTRGGALQHLVTSLEVRAIPSKIPDEISVDAELFQEGGRESLTAGEIELPEGVELVTPAETVVAQIVAASSAEPEAEADEEEGEEPTSVPIEPTED